MSINEQINKFETDISSNLLKIDKIKENIDCLETSEKDKERIGELRELVEKVTKMTDCMKLLVTSLKEIKK
jgi:uncharacterized protein YacL (UPF0231 family)